MATLVGAPASRPPGPAVPAAVAAGLTARNAEWPGRSARRLPRGARTHVAARVDELLEDDQATPEPLRRTVTPSGPLPAKVVGSGVARRLLPWS